jgi:hypothetical protein
MMHALDYFPSPDVTSVEALWEDKEVREFV